MDPEQILLDGNDFEDGSDYGDYEFIQDQDALSLNAPLAPISCQSSPNEDSLAISQSLDEQTVGDTGSSSNNTNRDAIRTAVAQNHNQPKPQHQKLTIKTIILSASSGSSSSSSGVTGGSSTSLVTLNSGTASSSSSNASSPASSSPSSVSSPAPVGGSTGTVRFGLGGGKPSAAALRRGPGRPKKDFIPLLKMSSSGGNANSSTAASGSGASGYGTSTMIKLSGATIVAASSLGGGSTSPSAESKIVKR
uniref:Uncharacterized protein n=1 Tax=Anopheles culicifacies TaxID=139723 RepID=A0A182MHJ1_9DIPT